MKGGGFTIMSGGGSHVQGPPNSAIADNNQLALAILIILPLANYVRMYAANMLVRRVFLVAMMLSLVSVLGSYSRGAFIALAGLMVVGWFRSARRSGSTHWSRWRSSFPRWPSCRPASMPA